MPEMGTKPVNKYLPPREKAKPSHFSLRAMAEDKNEAAGLLGWLDRALERL